MKRTVLPLVALALAPTAVYSDVLLQDNFAYPNGRLVDVSANLWTVHSGTSPLNVVGGHAVIDQSDATGGREDVNRLLSTSFNPVTDNAAKLYAGFTLNCSALPFNGGSSTAGSYFAHFKAGTSQYARVGANTEGAAPGTFRLAIANADWTSATSIEHPQNLSLGVTYNVVVLMDLATDQSTLWINPTDENGSGVTATDAISYSGAINAFALRQGTTGTSPNAGGPGTFALGDLRVTTSFVQVQSVPEPSTWALFLLGGASLLWRRRRPE